MLTFVSGVCVCCVQGLLQVKLLPRLRYILEVMTPPPPVVDMILRILTRMSRHSLQSASEVRNSYLTIDASSLSLQTYSLNQWLVSAPATMRSTGLQLPSSDGYCSDALSRWQ